MKAMVVYTEPVGNAESFVVTATIDGRQGCCGMCFRLINTKLIFWGLLITCSSLISQAKLYE